jgi:hypothetical protein
MRETNESYVVSQNELDLKMSHRVESERVMPGWASIVLCVFLLLDERMEGDVYGFGVKGIEITKVAEMAEMTEGV